MYGWWQDYLANSVTVDSAYSVLIDHALAERGRRLNSHYLIFQTSQTCQSFSTIWIVDFNLIADQDGQNNGEILRCPIQ